MTPICYEEAIPSGTTPPCAELVSAATETFVKDTLAIIFARTRSNGPAVNGGIMTRKYRKQLQAEEEGWLRGEVEKNTGNGLLPIEVKEAQGRRPLGMADLRLAMQVGGGSLLGGMPLVAERVADGWVETEDIEVDEGDGGETGVRFSRVNVIEDLGDGGNGDDGMDVDENDWGWEGAKESERMQLGSLLDELLSSS
jgi:transcriptional coactivator HFI1/ADA1